MKILYAFHLIPQKKKLQECVLLICETETQENDVPAIILDYYRTFAETLQFSVYGDETSTEILTAYTKNRENCILWEKFVRKGRNKRRKKYLVEFIPGFYEHKKAQKIQNKPIARNDSKPVVLTETDRKRFFPHLSEPVLPVHDGEYFMPNYHDKI